MKVTKLGHSCVLVEVEGRVALFDSGAWADRSLIDAVQTVDEVIYTHEAKRWLQGLLENVFAGSGITLLANENGRVIEL